MKSQFVTYEIALALKELGFDEDCLAIYRDSFDDFGVTLISKGIEIKGTQSKTIYCSFNDTMICLAPLWQQAIDWFNDKYGIFITLALVANGYGFYIHKNYNTTNKGENYGFHPTLHKAREEAILKAIELIKNK